MYFDEFHNHKWARNLKYARSLIQTGQLSAFYHGEDLPDGDIYLGAGDAKEGRKKGDKDIGIYTIQQDLEYAVERNEAGCIFPVALCQFVPYNHHCNTSGKTDEDEADHVFGVITQESDRKDEHQYRADDPIEE